MLILSVQFQKERRSILPAGDTSQFISSKDADIAILEEPEHLNWYHHGKRWTDKFNHVVGVVHTNYLEYIKREIRSQDIGTLPKKCCLVLGSEKEGISAEVLAVIDRNVEIKTVGVTRSLSKWACFESLWPTSGLRANISNRCSNCRWYRTVRVVERMGRQGLTCELTSRPPHTSGS